MSLSIPIAVAAESAPPGHADTGIMGAPPTAVCSIVLANFFVNYKSRPVLKTAKHQLQTSLPYLSG